MRYENFVLHIGSKRGEVYSVQVLESPAGEGSGKFEPPLTRAEIGSFFGQVRKPRPDRRGGDASLSLPPDGFLREPTPTGRQGLKTRDLRRRRGNLPQSQTAQEVGKKLFESIFRGQVRALFERSLGHLEGRGEVGLRLKLRLDSEAFSGGILERMPWELMYHEEAGLFLGLDRYRSIVRYLDVPRPPRPIPLPEELRVLAVVAEPATPGLASLNLDAETERMRLLSKQHADWHVEVERNASVSSLRRRLTEDGPFHVVHFMGHGGFDPDTGEGLLYFEGPGGSAQPINGQALAVKLADFGDLGLVFLNACETASSAGGQGRDPFGGVATALVRGGLPAVVAMQRPISDRAAIVFSDAFYSSLSEGACADEALVEGRQAIHSASPKSLEWMIPVLFARLKYGEVFEQRESPTLNRLPRFVVVFVLASVTLSIFLLVVSLLNRYPSTAITEKPIAGQVFATTVDGVNGWLESVEIMSDATLRLQFSFSNRTSENQDLGFDFTESSLIDEMGYSYEVVRSSGPQNAQKINQTLAPGESSRFWVEVSIPSSSKGALSVHLANTGNSAVAYPPFKLELRKYTPLRVPGLIERRNQQSILVPGEASESPEQGVEQPRPEEKPFPAPRVEFPQNLLPQPIALDSWPKDLEARVIAVEPTPQGRIRLWLQLWNRSAADILWGFDYPKTYVLDQKAKRYGVLSAQPHADVRNEAFQATVAAASRAVAWLEFDESSLEAGGITLWLRSAVPSSSRFKPARIEKLGPLLPREASRITQQPLVDKTPVRIIALDSSNLPLTMELSRPVDPKKGQRGISNSKSFEEFTDESWRAFFRRKNGEIHFLEPPVEKYSDEEWLNLGFTESKAPKSRLLVLPLSNDPSRSHGDPNFGSGYWYSLPKNPIAPVEAIEEFMSLSLWDTDRFELVSREDLKNAIADLGFERAERVSKEGATKVGRELEAPYVLSINVDSWAPNVESSRFGGQGKSFAETALSLRVLDTRDSEVSFAATIRGSWAHSWDRPLADVEVEMPINYAIAVAIHKATYELAASLRNQPWQGTIVDVTAGLVILNGGENRGVTKGPEFLVRRKDKEMLDPETGKSLGFRYKVIGTLRVSAVEEGMATAEIVEKLVEFRPGDQVWAENDL